MDKNIQIMELREIYREMDIEGKKMMQTAATDLFAIQKTFGQKSQAPVGSTHIRSTSRLNCVPGYLVIGLFLFLSACFFWITLINPALSKLGDTPLIMLRIIMTALFGMFIIGTGILRFIIRKLSIPWLLLAIGAGILCVDPGVLTDLIGIILIALIVAVHVFHGKREKAEMAA
jgi:hypothetical protein